MFQPRFHKLGVNSHVPSPEGFSDGSQRLPRERFDLLWCHTDPILVPCLDSSKFSLAADVPCQNRGGCLPSCFAAREADSSLHNSIVDSSSMHSDSYFSLAYRLTSSVQCSPLTVKPIASRCSMSVTFFVCSFIFSKFCSAMFALCLLRCFRTTDRAFFSRDSHHFLRNIFSASKCSFDCCIRPFTPLLSC